MWVMDSVDGLAVPLLNSRLNLTCLIKQDICSRQEYVGEWGEEECQRAIKTDKEKAPISDEDSPTEELVEESAGAFIAPSKAASNGCVARRRQGRRKEALLPSSRC
jgi:hypothetical protein